MADFLITVGKFEILKPQVWLAKARDGKPCVGKELGEPLRTVQHLSARIANQFVSEKYTQTQLARVSPGPAIDNSSCSGVLAQQY